MPQQTESTLDVIYENWRCYQEKAQYVFQGGDNKTSNKDGNKTVPRLRTL